MYLELSKFLEKLSFKLKQKAIYFELKQYIKSGKNYFKSVYYCNRGIGKTYTLIELAYKYKCPIITQTICMGRYIERMSKKIGKPVEAFGYSDYRQLKGKRFKLVLCDEGMSPDAMSELRKCTRQIVGYHYVA